MPLPNVVALSERLGKFYKENIASGINDFLEASQGFPPLTIEAKAAKLASEAPELAGVIALGASKHIPRLKHLIWKKFGIKVDDPITVRAENPFHIWTENSPNLRYSSPDIRRFKEMWSETLGRSIKDFRPLKLNPKTVVLSPVLDSPDFVPNIDIIQQFLGKRFVNRLHNRGDIFELLPKKYRNLVNTKQYKNFATSYGRLFETLLEALLREEGLSAAFVGTKYGKPSQFIELLEK